MRRHRDEDAHGRYPGKKQRCRIASDGDEDEDEEEGTGLDSDDEDEEGDQEQENQGHGQGQRRLILSDDREAPAREVAQQEAVIWIWHSYDRFEPKRSCYNGMSLSILNEWHEMLRRSRPPTHHVLVSGVKKLHRALVQDQIQPVHLSDSLQYIVR
jgi:hypothetical protein